MRSIATVKKSEKYSPENRKQRQFHEDVALFVAGTSMTKLGVQSALFKNMILNIDAKLSIPLEPQIRKTTNQICGKLSKALQESLGKALRVSICVDIWSRKTLSASVLGVTVHFYNREKQEISHFVMNLQGLDYPHKAERIVQALNSVLAKWGFEEGIDDPRVFKIVTDSGSNMVKAFRNTVELIRILHDAEPAEDIQEVLDANLEQEEPDEDETEEDRQEILDEHIREKRLGCVDHKLANLLKNVMEKNDSAKQLLDNAYELCRKLRASGKASEAFSTMGTGRKPVLPVKTRWVFNYYVLDRLIDLEDVVHVICRDVVEGINNLTTLDWKKVKCLRDILYPFEIYVRELEGENYVTVSRVIPALLDIKIRLSALVQSLSYCKEIAKELVKEMSVQFSFALDSHSPKFNVFYAMSTFLDPWFCQFLSLAPAADLKQKAKEEILMYLKRSTTNPTGVPKASNGSEENDNLTNPEDELFGLLEKELSNMEKKQSGTVVGKEEDEIRRYLDTLPLFKESQKESREAKIPRKTAHQFWEDRKKELPLLYDLAVDVLVVPATSAPVERVFSQAGLCDDPKRRSMALANLEREVIIRVNGSYLMQ